MKAARFFVIAAFAPFLAPALIGAHIGCLYPAGGRAGETVEILVAGSSLGGIRSASISGSGVEVLKVTPFGRIPHCGGTQKQYIHKWLVKIENGDPAPPERPSEEVTRTWSKCAYWDNLAGITLLEREVVARKALIRSDPLQKSPSLATLMIVKLRIAPDAEPGRREFRLTGWGKISDPLPFYIDNVPEVREERFILPERPKQPTDFTAPAVLNGRIFPGETDTFVFKAEKGEKLTFTVRARDLVPFLGDGVPGHFQAVLEVYDTFGRLVASADDHHFDPDPVLYFTAPRAGEYRLKIRDALYRGREDFIYRIKVVRGRAASPKPEPPALSEGKWRSPAPGLEVALPAHISFVIGKPGGKVSWSFQGKAGETLEAAVLARRLGSPLDAALTLRDERGKVLCTKDDAKGALIGTILQQADPSFCFTLPADGKYSIEVADASGTGGPESVGYLSLTAPAPDIEIYACPSGLSVAADSPSAIRVQAVRRGGFNGPIVLSTPPGSLVRIVGTNTLEPGMDRGLFTIQAARSEKPDGRVLPIAISAFAELPGGTAVRRKVRGADELMQAFAYTHLVPAERFLAVRIWGQPGPKARLVDPNLVCRIAPGGTAELRLWRAAKQPSAPHFSLVDPPSGVTLGEAKEADDMLVLPLRAEKDAKTGKFNMTVRVEHKYKDKKGKSQRASYLLPAFRIEVVK